MNCVVEACLSWSYQQILCSYTEAFTFIFAVRKCVCLKANLWISWLIYVIVVCAVLEPCQEQSVPLNVLILAYLYRVFQRFHICLWSEVVQGCKFKNWKSGSYRSTISPSFPLRLEDSPPQPPRKQQSPSNNGTGKRQERSEGGKKKEAGQPDGRGWGSYRKWERKEDLEVFWVWEYNQVCLEGRGVVMVFMTCRFRIFIVYVWVLQQESSYQHIIHLSVRSSNSPSCCTASWLKNTEHQGVKCKMTFLFC